MAELVYHLIDLSGGLAIDHYSFLCNKESDITPVNARFNSDETIQTILF
jgi:hypothetical protein